MPLLPGKSNIGHNVREMEAHGHSKAQSVAAALRTAYDTEPVPGTGNFNSAKKAAAQKAGAIVSHDEPFSHPTTAMTVADINAKNRELWGNVGPAESQEAAPALAGTKVGGPVPVYGGRDAEDAQITRLHGGLKSDDPIIGKKANPSAWKAQTEKHGIQGYENEKGPVALGPKNKKSGGDEVSPTQSAPPDDRGDNLLERTGGGIPGTEDEADAVVRLKSGLKSDDPILGAKSNPKGWAAQKAKYGVETQKTPKTLTPAQQASGRNYNGPNSSDELVEGTEALPPPRDAAPKTDLEKERAKLPPKAQAAAHKEDRVKQGAAWNKEHERVMGSEAHGMRGR